MKLTVRSFLEMALGLGCLVAVVIVQFTGTTFGPLTGLTMGLLSLVGVVILAHAVWLASHKDIN